MAGLADLFINVTGSVTYMPVNGTDVTTFDVVPDNGFGLIQLIFLMSVYGYILYLASNLIAGGSEMLELVMSPGLIGGLVLPVMGAVPDGAIVLFSGLGPDAQKQLSVGVGTLAGSTIMLLTIPWSLCHFLGRVDIIKEEGAAPRYNYKGKPKLSPDNSIFSMAGLMSSGVQVTSEIPTNAKIMLATAAAYLIIWVPSVTYNDLSHAEQAKKEHPFALAGLIVTAIAFVGYSVYMVQSANAADAYKERQAALIRQRFEKDVSFNIYSFLQASAGAEAGSLDAPLVAGAVSPEVRQRAAPVIKSLWAHADMNQDGCLDAEELRFLLCEAVKAKHMSQVPAAEVAALMAEFDKDKNATLDFAEFQDLFFHFVATHNVGGEEGAPAPAPAGAAAPSLSLNGADTPERHQSFKQQAAETAEEEEEEEDEDEENAHLTPFQITAKATTLILVGVGVVTLFSDPMVDVLSEFGNRINVPPFYISFIVTPLVSNASELIASLMFAAKRTSSSMTMTFSALLGAATMNNTFVLAVFLGIIVGKGDLRWAFTAETLVILIVEIIMFVIALRTEYPAWLGWVVASLFPLSIVLVYILENVAKLD